ncbi:ABC transporter permease [Agromyces sp. SYSU T00194]|uniref:ABC transporter permease n=1 Tax=Agromyces chitinivorans TaxID=3158560 RepID=UPI003397D629
MTDVRDAARTKAVLIPDDEPVTSRVQRVLRSPWTIRALSLLLFLSVWEYFGRDMPLVISSPSAIAQAAVENFVPDILPALGETLRGLFAGMALSVVVGVPLGLLMSFSKVVEIALAPYVYALYSTPRITLIPVLVLWLGISFEMRVGIVFLGAVFPILLNTYLGGKEVPRGLLDVGRAFRASPFKVYRSIMLRSSLPYVFSGFRLGLGQGLTGVVLAEVATSAGGIGNLITLYAKYFQIDAMFVAIVLLGLIAVVIQEFMARLNVRLTEPWNHAHRRSWLTRIKGVRQ